LCQVASTAWAGPGRGGHGGLGPAPGAEPRGGFPVPGAGTERSQLAPRGRGVRQAEVDVHLVRQRGQDLQVCLCGGDLQGGSERAGPALPVHERAALLRHRGDREHDIGPVGDGAGPKFQADDELGASPARRARRPGRAGPRGRPRRSTRAPMLAGGGRGEDAGRCRGPARPAGTRRPRPGPGRRARRVIADSDGRPGSRLGSAPASTAPRSPARRGNPGQRARRSSSARATASADSAAGRLGQPLAGEDDRAGRGQWAAACQIPASTAAAALGGRRSAGAGRDFSARRPRALRLMRRAAVGQQHHRTAVGQAAGWRATASE
jgi:hypothetical protein